MLRKRKMSSPAWLVVGNKAPFNVMAASPELPEFLEFEIHEVLGRSMRMIFGPMTNVAELRKAVIDSATKSSYTASFMLYTKNGQGRMLTVEIVPAHNGDGEATHCVMTIDHSDWVPKKVAVAEDTRAKLVLKADKPYSVECVSDNFVQLYALSADSLMGRTLRPIFGPRTDAQTFDAALVLAKAGKTQNLSLWTCKTDMSHLLVHITIFPVAEQGAICNFMLVFKGAIDVKPTAASTEGAKCGPPQRRVRPNSMRLAQDPTTSGAAKHEDHEFHRSNSLTEVQKRNRVADPNLGDAAASEKGSPNLSQEVLDDGEERKSMDRAASHAEMVREELEKRAGGVELLIQRGHEVMEDLGDEAMGGVEQHMSREEREEQTRREREATEEEEAAGDRKSVV